MSTEKDKNQTASRTAAENNGIALPANINGIMISTGYKPKTTFWQDFSIADKFGEKGIRDTFSRAFREWKHDRVYLTELVMVLNHKIWQHYENKKRYIAAVYDELWKQADEYAMSNLKGADLQYYIRTLD